MADGITILRTENGNLTRVELGDAITLWFSYETIVAFTVAGINRVSENVWGTTTARHLNTLRPADQRVPHRTFLAELEVVLTHIAVGAGMSADALAEEFGGEPDVLELADMPGFEGTTEALNNLTIR